MVAAITVTVVMGVHSTLHLYLSDGLLSVCVAVCSCCSQTDITAGSAVAAMC
jgi:hypothetical protein